MSNSAFENLMGDSVKLVLYSKDSKDSKCYMLHQLFFIQNFLGSKNVFLEFSDELSKINFQAKKGKASDKSLSFFDFLSRLIELARDQNEDLLIYNWSQWAANSLYNLEIDQKSFPELGSDFLTMSKMKSLIAVREIFEDKLKKFKKKNEGYFEQLTWAEIDELISDQELDQKFIIRLFLDFDKPLAKIQSEYQSKIKKNSRKGADLAAMIPIFFESRLPWKLVNSETENRWFFTLKNADKKENFLIVEVHYHIDDGINLAIGFQYKKFLEWQKASFNPSKGKAHTKHYLISFIPKEIYSKNKAINSLGGWKFLPSQSKKLLEDRLENILEHLEKANSFINFNLNLDVSSLLDQYTLESAIGIFQKFKEIDDQVFDSMDVSLLKNIYEMSNKEIFEFDFFRSKLNTLLLLANHKWDKKIKPVQEIELLESHIKEKRIKEDKKNELHGLLDQLRAGKALHSNFVL